MSPSTAKAKVPQALKLTAALAATSGALNQTLLAVARAQGVNGVALVRSGHASLRSFGGTIIGAWNNPDQ